MDEQRSTTGPVLLCIVVCTKFACCKNSLHKTELWSQCSTCINWIQHIYTPNINAIHCNISDTYLYMHRCFRKFSCFEAKSVIYVMYVLKKMSNCNFHVTALDTERRPNMSNMRDVCTQKQHHHISWNNSYSWGWYYKVAH